MRRQEPVKIHSIVKIKWKKSCKELVLGAKQEILSAELISYHQNPKEKLTKRPKNSSNFTLANYIITKVAVPNQIKVLHQALKYQFCLLYNLLGLLQRRHPLY